MRKAMTGVLFMVMILGLTTSAFANYVITDFDANGSYCSAIGIWDATTKTCSLTTDIYYEGDYMVIDVISAGITIDGNGHTLSGIGLGTGIRSVGYGVEIKNLIIKNFNIGIFLDCISHDNVIKNNTISDNYYGVVLNTVMGTKMYNNNMLRNLIGVYNYGNRNTVLNLTSPVGGNYWDDYDTSGEGCNDLNADGFCDSPYYSYWAGSGDVGVDYLPWSKLDGWVTPSVIIDNTIADIQQMLSSGEIAGEGTAASLTTVLDSAFTAEQRGNEQAAEQILNGFIHQVEGQASAGRISEAAAIQLIESARKAIGQ